MAPASIEKANELSKTNYETAVAEHKLVSRCGMFTWAFIRTPFSHQIFKQPSNHTTFFQTVEEASAAVRKFHNSIASNAERCFKLFHSVASQNPFLNKLFSVSSEFHNFCQVRCRNRQNGFLLHHNFAAVLPGDSVAGLVVANGLINFLNLYNTLLIVRLVLTWFPNTPPVIVSPLSTLCDPYLNIFRGLIPPLGGTLDLSPILAFLVLNAFTSTASALPAELPPTELSQDGSSPAKVSDITQSQKKWNRRILGSRTKVPRDVN